jgi:plasmid stabilization system protein ParE
MSSFALIVAPRAEQQIDRAAAWWRANRPASPALFEDELEAAFARIVDTPGTVPIYHRAKDQEYRRLLLPRSRYHLFFTLRAEEPAAVIVLAVWHAVRRRAPRL